MTVSNSSCLISLEAIGKLDLLSALYGSIVIPPAVLAEWGALATSWIVTQQVANQHLVARCGTTWAQGRQKRSLWRLK